MGKLVVLEGIDGSGKSTQFRILTDRLVKAELEFKQLVFPRYENPSSALIRMYLGGEFGENPDDVSPWAASTFYAVDRYASYRQDWEQYYKDGGIIITDRYTTSNAIHQGGKLEPAQRTGFFSWLSDFEYNLMGIPSPDLVLFCDTSPEICMKQIISRGRQRDIHEKDADYLRKCAQCARQAAEHYGWKRIDCSPNGVMRSAESIAEEIFGQVRTIIEGS